MTWTIEVEQSGGGWTIDTAISRPNQDVETEYISTQQKLRLANGSNAFVTPETKRLKEPFQMFFADTTSAFRTQIENYILNGDKVRITSHTNETFIGRFISMRRIWLVGISPDAYDVQITFERTE